MLFGCPTVDNERVALNISAYKALVMGQGLLTYLEILASYLGEGWGGPCCSAGTWKENGGAAECWLTTVHEP